MRILYNSRVIFSSFYLLICFCLSGCGVMAQTSIPTELPDISIENSLISASAKLIPIQQASLSFVTGGEDLEVFYQTGDFVEKGQILAKVKQDEFEFAIDQADLNWKRAQLAFEQLNDLPSKESIAAAQAVLSNAEANFDRLDRANAREIELDAAQDQIDSAKLSLDSIQAGASDLQLRIAQLDIDAASLALKQALFAKENSEIIMPFDGYVIEIYMHDQEYAPPAQPVLLVADLSSMQVETTDLSEVDVNRLNPGDFAKISFDAIPDQTFQGQVEKIALKASSGAAVNFSVILNLVEVPTNLRWGMTAFVEFEVD
jgi:multidrug resistance efflux pump